MKTFILFAALALGVHGSTCAVIREVDKKWYLEQIMTHRRAERNNQLEMHPIKPSKQTLQNNREGQWLAAIFTIDPAEVRCFSFETESEATEIEYIEKENQSSSLFWYFIKSTESGLQPPHTFSVRI